MIRKLLPALAFLPALAAAQTVPAIPRTGLAADSTSRTSDADLAGMFGTKADATGGVLKNPSLVSPSFNLDGTPRPATQWLAVSQPSNPTVFIGGVIGLTALIPLANVAQSTASGKVGIYEHGNGMAALTAAQRTALFSTWGLPPGGGGKAVGEIACFQPGDAGIVGYLAYFGTASQFPAQVNMNCLSGAGDGTGTYTAVAGDARPGTVYTGYTTAADLVVVENGCNSAFGNGSKNVALVATPNGGGEDMDDPFASAPFWQNVRAAALYCGGIALDTPPNYVFRVPNAPKYQSIAYQVMAWAQQQGLRSSLILSPFAVVADAAGNTGAKGYDPTFTESSMQWLGMIKAAGTAPTQIVIENYDLSAGASENAPVTDTTAESLNAVALYVARTFQAATPGTAQPTGTGALPEAGMLAALASAAPALRLSASHPGPLNLADIMGAGTMAAQDASSVQVRGGLIGGSTTINTTGSAFVGSLTMRGGVSSPVLSGNPGVDGDFHLTGAGGVAGLRMTGTLTAPSIANTLFTAGFTVQGGASSPAVGADANGNLGLSVSSGTASLLVFPSTFAQLPATCPARSVRFVTDARNTGEAAGLGTGALAYCNSANAWFANGAPVTH